MAIEVDTSKDIREYKINNIGPFNNRQIVCIGLSLVYSVPLAAMMPFSTENKVLFGLIICVCVIFMARDVINYKRADKEYDRLKEYMTEEKNEDSVMKIQTPALTASEKTLSINKEFDRLYEINHDLVAILSIPDLDLEYPVVQTADNVKYLDLTFEGKNNPAGCLFMDY